MRGKKRPMLSDLRESGSIEQDADIVMFIDRSMDEVEAESDDRPDMGEAELIVAKHRNGPTRDIKLAFNAEFTRFMDFIDDSRVGGLCLIAAEPRKRYTRLMPKQLTFIHAADLHLGAPFRGLRALSDVWANRLFSAIVEAYDRVIDAALDRQGRLRGHCRRHIRHLRAPPTVTTCTFSRDSSASTKRASHPTSCSGNHDPYTSWTRDFFAFPPSTRMLPADRPGFELFVREGEPLCIIGGRGYYNQTWPIDE